MRTIPIRFLLAAMATGVWIWLPTLASAAVPTVTQVFTDTNSSPQRLNIVGTGFDGTSTVTLGSTALTVTARSATVLTASLPPLVAYGDYLLSVTNPGNKGGVARYDLTVPAEGPPGPRGPRVPQDQRGRRACRVRWDSRVQSGRRVLPVLQVRMVRWVPWDRRDCPARTVRWDRKGRRAYKVWWVRSVRLDRRVRKAWRARSAHRGCKDSWVRRARRAC